MTFRQTAMILTFLLTLALPLTAPTSAQEGDAPTTDETTTEAPETAPVPPALASARATLRTFLESFDPAVGRPQDGPRTLDLSRIRDDVRSSVGKELAQQLKEVLDRTQFIDFEEVPDDPAGEPYRLPVKDSDGEVVGEIVVAPDDRGAWRFTADTVDAVPELYQSTRELEKIEGVLEVEPTTPAMWLRAKMPAPLLERSLLLENWQWLGLLLLAVLAVILDRLVTATVQSAIERYLERRMESIDAGDLRRALRPTGIFAAALLWWPAIFWLGLPIRVLEILAVAVKFVAATAFVAAAYRLVDVAAAVLELRAARSASKFDDLLVPLFRKSSKIFVAAFGLVFIADTLDLPITSVIAGLGIGGLALALAAQDAVRNLFGSLLVILDRPFSVGDWVKIGDVEGSVAELGFRSTRIKTFYDSTITVPNGNLITATVDNLGVRTYRRWSTHLSITYDTPPEKIEAFCEGVRELVRRHPYTRKDSFHVYLNSFAASSIDVLLYVFFQTPDWATELRERHRLMVDILRLATELGVEFAFPTQTLYLHRPAEAGEMPGAEGYGERVSGTHQEARERARRLVDGSLGGRVPPPVGAASEEVGGDG